MKFNIDKIEYIFLFIIIFVENSFWLRTQYPANVRYIILLGITGLFILFKVIKKKDLFLQKKNILIFMLLIIFITFSSAIHNEIDEFYFAYIITLFIALIVSTFIPFTSVKEKYCNIMLIICTFSVITLFISYILPQIIYLFPSLNNTYAGEGRNYFLGLNVIDMASQYRKNKGVFFEHGIFSFYISIAIIFQFSDFKKISNKKLFIYILAIISTMSTTGWIIAGITVIAILISNKKYEISNKFKILIIVSIGILIIIYPYLPPGYRLLFSKFSEGTESGSFAERISALKISIIAFINNPILGASQQYISYLKSNSISNIMTFTIMNWFAYYGIVVGVIFNLGIIRFFFRIKNSLMIKVLSFIILIIAIITQNMIGSIILNMLMYYSLDQYLVKES